MSPTGLVWDHIKKIRAPGVPKEFESKLKSILQEQYLNENRSLADVVQSIQQEHIQTITCRQITNRLKRYGMLKRDNLDISQTPGSLGNGATSVTSTGPVASTTPHQLEPVVEFVSASQSRQTSRSRMPDRMDGLAQLESTELQVKQIEFKPKDGSRLPSGTSVNLSTIASVPPFADQQEAEQTDRTRKTQTSPLSSNPIIALKNARSPSRVHESNAGSKHSRLRLANERSHSRSILVETKNTSSVSASISVERQNAIADAMFHECSQSHTVLMQLSVSELHFGIRIGVLMLYYGQDLKAFECLERLFWSTTVSKSIPRTCRLVQLTKILMRLLQTGLCAVREFRSRWLWKAFWNALGRPLERNRDRCDPGVEYLDEFGGFISSEDDLCYQNSCEDKVVLTGEHILAVGELALMAYLQGHKIMFRNLCRLWQESECAESIAKLHKRSKYPILTRIDQGIEEPSFLHALQGSAVKWDRWITTCIRQSLGWIRKQLVRGRYTVQNEPVNLSGLLRHIFSELFNEKLEQQLLLSFLSSRDLESPWLWPKPPDFIAYRLLPCSTSLEWSSSEMPFFTLAVLISLLTFNVKRSSDLLLTEAWFDKMQTAVDRLLRDIGTTTARFRLGAWESFPNVVEHSGGRRIKWISPMEFDPIQEPGPSEPILEIQTWHLVCSMAVFGSTIPGVSQELTDASIVKGHDPTLLSTPSSSLSGFDSMRSIYMRELSLKNRDGDSHGIRVSISPKSSSRDGSDIARDLLNCMASGYPRVEPWTSSYVDQQDEDTLMSVKDDLMDLDD